MSPSASESGASCDSCSTSCSLTSVEAGVGAVAGDAVDQRRGGAARGRLAEEEREVAAVAHASVGHRHGRHPDRQAGLDRRLHRGEAVPGSDGSEVRPEQVAARPGWSAMPAVRDGELHEIKSPIILQPGPAALFDGLDAMHAIIAAWASR